MSLSYVIVLDDQRYIWDVLTHWFIIFGAKISQMSNIITFLHSILQSLTLHFFLPWDTNSLVGVSWHNKNYANVISGCVLTSGSMMQYCQLAH